MGYHDFKPNPSWFPKSKTRYEVTFRFTKSMYYTKKELGDDVSDINKLGGFTWFFNANNKDSALLGWRPDQGTKNFFEVFLYVNDRKGGFRYEKLGSVPAEQLCDAWLSWSSRKVSGALIDHREKRSIQTIDQRRRGWAWTKLYREVGSWFGGSSPAPHDMHFKAFINY